MVIVQGVFRLRPEDRDRYLARSVETMKQTREEKGCIEYVMAADPLDPERVVLSERWESQDDLKQHSRALAARRKEAAERGEDPGPEILSREITVFQVSAADTLA